VNNPRIIIDAVIFCPHCGARHVDEDRNNEKWTRRAHTTHRCQSCHQDFDVFVSGQKPTAAQTADVLVTMTLLGTEPKPVSKKAIKRKKR